MAEELTAQEEARLSDAERAALKADDDGEELISATGTMELEDGQEAEDDGVVVEDISETPPADDTGKPGEQAESDVKLTTPDGEKDKTDITPDDLTPAQPDPPAPAAPSVAAGKLFTDVDDEEDYYVAPTLEYRTYVPTVPIQKAQEDLAELVKTYKNGDLDDDSYNEQRLLIEGAIIAERTEINNVNKHNEWVKKTLSDGWTTSQKKFYNKPENSEWFKNDVKYGAHCEAVRVLSPKFRARPHSELLKAAVEYAKEQMGVPSVAQKVAPKVPDAPKPKAPVIPVTLSDVPGASVGTDGGKFAALNAALRSGDPAKIEKLGRNMSKEQMDEWLYA
jgi:hypothetical protein